MRVTLLAVVAAALVLPAAVQAATTNFTIPIEFDIAACNGDTIELSGQLLGVSTATANSAGGSNLGSGRSGNAPLISLIDVVKLE